MPAADGDELNAEEVLDNDDLLAPKTPPAGAYGNGAATPTSPHALDAATLEETLRNKLVVIEALQQTLVDESSEKELLQKEVEELRASAGLPVLNGATLAQSALQKAEVGVLEDQVLAAEEKARQAQDIAQEAVGHAEELQQMVSEQRNEADDLRRDLAAQREAIRKYEESVEAQIKMLEQNQPAELMEALSRASHELQAAGAKLSLGRTELAAQKAGHTIVVAELEQKVSEAAKTAALSAYAAGENEELRSLVTQQENKIKFYADQEKFYATRTAEEVQKVQTKLEQRDVKLQVLQREVEAARSRVTVLEAAASGSEAADQLLNSTTLLEKRRADKFQALNETLLGQLEQERRVQETLVQDSQVLREALTSREVMIKHLEKNLRDASPRPQRRESKELLQQQLSAAEEALHKQLEAQQAQREAYEREMEAQKKMLEEGTGAEKLMASAKMGMLKRSGTQIREEAEAAENTLETLHALERKAATVDVLQRELEGLRNRLSAATDEKDELAEQLAAQQDMNLAVRREAEMVRASSERAIASMQKRVMQMGGVKSPYNAPPIALRRWNGPLPESVLPSESRKKMRSHQTSQGSLPSP